MSIEIFLPWAIPAFVAAFTGAGLALLVFLQRPGALANRAAALFLYANGLTWLCFYGTLAFRLPAVALWGAPAAGYFVSCYAILAYLFLLSTLGTPVVGWLRVRVVRVVMATVLVVLSVVSVLVGLSAPAAAVFDSGWAAILFFGVVAAGSAWRRSPPGLVRRKNRSFALAFIVHDAALGLFLVVPNLLFWFIPDAAWSFPVWIIAIPAFAAMVLQALIVYGILSTQLFDIDLKLRWGVSQGFLTAVFLAGAFAVPEILAGFLSEQMGLVTGVLVTAVLLMALSPLRRLADMFAARVVPGAVDSPEYRALRKELVYRAQLEELMADEVVSLKERRALLRLQETLGIDAGVAARLEREVLDMMSAGKGARPAQVST